MRFTILEEIKSTLSKSLFYNHYSQITSNQILVFDERRKPEYLGKNLSWQSRDPANSIHMTPGAEIKPGPHWWKASALTTRPTLPMITQCLVHHSPPFLFVSFKSLQTQMEVFKTFPTSTQAFILSLLSELVSMDVNLWNVLLKTSTCH